MKIKEDGEPFAKVSELWIVEFFAIVHDEGVRNPKAENDVLLHEILHLGLYDCSDRLGF